MVGKTAGVVSRIKNIVTNCTSSHCVLHRQALVCKNIPINIKTVLDETVQIINFVKCRPLQSRLFKIICEDMGSQQSLEGKVCFMSQLRCRFGFRLRWPGCSPMMIGSGKALSSLRWS